MEDYFFDTIEMPETDEKVYVLVIYDVVDDKRRLRLSNLLQGYGFRIQKSAFEAKISKRLYHKLKEEIGKYATDEDSIRMYKIIGKGQVTCYGKKEELEQNDVIVV